MNNIPVALPKDGVTLEDFGIVPPAEVRELIACVLLSEEEIRSRVDELAKEIARIYAEEEELILLPILTGAVFLATDIGRALAKSSSLNIKYDLTKASSLREQEAAGDTDSTRTGRRPGQERPVAG